MISKKDYIKKWCELALVRTKNINTKASSSYGLKHYCEESIGIYVSNQEIIEIMEKLGFIKQRCNGLNYQFNISKIINKVIFKNKLGKEYAGNSRQFHPRSVNINCDLSIDIFNFNYHLVYENDEVSEIITSNIELEEGTKFNYNGSKFEVTSKLINDILAENI